MGNAWVFPSISHSTGKCNKAHCMRRNGKLLLIPFPIVWVLFPCLIPITWYTSSHPSKHINVESTLKQRWSSTLFKRWYLVENESWADVHLWTLFQRWQNSVETTWIELRGFNVDEPTLFQRWNLVENESWANVCLSTLFQRWQNNVETTLIELRWFNVDDPMLFQRWY